MNRDFSERTSERSSKAAANQSDGSKGTSMPMVPVQLQSAQTPAIQMKEADEKAETTQLKPFQFAAKEKDLLAPTKPNNTGMPDNLKAGIENLSGFSMNDVNVHYNSPKPAQLQAFAYAQGTDIHIGPGQEKHLPHEAWHVVQQKQGRVQPTTQLKAGIPINDDEGLEHEADVMGQRSLNTPVQATSDVKTINFLPAQTLSTISTPQNAPAQLIHVKLQKARSKGASDTYVLAKAGEESEDTTTMSLEKRRQVLADLVKPNKKQWAAAIDSLRNEIAAMSKPVDEKQIILMTSEIDSLLVKKGAPGGLSAEDNIAVKKVAFQTLNAMEFLGGFNKGEKDAEKFRVLLLANIEKLNRLDDKVFSESREMIGHQADMNILPQEIAAYRQDIRSGSAWGGGSEASAVANAFHKHLSLYIIDSESKYVRVDTVGDLAGPLCQYSILNIGNHYVAIANGHTTGTLYTEAHNVFNPPGDGNCMFNALYYALSDGDTVQLVHPTSGANLDAEDFAGEARKIAATGITDLQATLSIEEILLSGQQAGVGSELKKYIHFKKYDSETIREMINKSGVEESYLLTQIKSKIRLGPTATISSILAKYTGMTEAYSEMQKTSQKQADVFVSQMDTIINTILNVVFFSESDTSELLEERPTTTEQELRKGEVEKYQHIYSVRTSEFNEKQLIITADKKDFVIDRIGQLVPRRVSRSISDQNSTEMALHGFIYPSEESPVSYSGGPTGSGVGDNKIKATKEMEHVEGVKPSPFLSTTKEASGTVNPEGKSFGSALYEIDLAYVPSSCIADLSTGRGVSYYMLGNYEKKSGGNTKAELIEQAKAANTKQTEYRKNLADHEAKVHGVKKPELYDAQVKATENPTLSGKEWQALMDIVRTTEVLIDCKIPRVALTKK